MNTVWNSKFRSPYDEEYMSSLDVAKAVGKVHPNGVGQSKAEGSVP